MDKMSLVKAPISKVIRNGEIIEIPTSEIVLNDVVKLMILLNELKSYLVMNCIGKLVFIQIRNIPTVILLLIEKIRTEEEYIFQNK